ncbi:MAG: hypothetical protein ACI9MR_000031 [Myxococcota bacterium]|jgi:hypothetical protein
MSGRRGFFVPAVLFNRVVWSLREAATSVDEMSHRSQALVSAGDDCFALAGELEKLDEEGDV